VKRETETVNMPSKHSPDMTLKYKHEVECKHSRESKVTGHRVVVVNTPASYTGGPAFGFLHENLFP